MEILPSLLGFISSRVKVLKSNISDLIDNPAEASQNLTYKMLQDLNAGVYAMAGTTPEANEEMGKKFVKAKQNGAPMPPLNTVNMASESTLGAGTMLGKGAKLFNFQKEATALKMKDAGFPTEEIRRRTDTWLGHPDKKPRQEISDANASIDPNQLLTDMNADRYLSTEPVRYSKDTAKLHEVLKHPSLFANYPELKDINVIYGHGVKNSTGYFFPRTNTILAAGRTPEEARSIIIHEIQHAIQQREGWSPGASLENIPYDSRTKQQYEQKVMDLKRNKNIDFTDKDNLKNTDRRLRTELYMKTAGEADARLAQARQYFTQEDLRAFDPTNFYDIPLKEMLIGKP